MEALGGAPESILKKASTSISDAINEQPQSQVMDKLIEKIISMAMPLPSTMSNAVNGRVEAKLMDRVDIQKTRPALSLPVMSRNCILLLQRISIPFETIDAIIRIINWEDPLWNITIGLIITLIILKPIHLITLPLMLLCFQVILPAYTAKNDGHWDPPKPVSEFSREFLLNVTDLQNHMLLYVDSWNAINRMAMKFLFFEDERLTWMLFVSLLGLIIFLETFGASIVWHLVPIFKLGGVVLLWFLLISLHPQLRIKFLDRIHDEELRLKTLSLLNKLDDSLKKDIEVTFKKKEERDLKLFAVYELHCWNQSTETWQFACFGTDSYPLNSHIRKNSVPFKGAENLNSIVPPDKWHWVNVLDADTESPLVVIDEDAGKVNKEKRRRRKSDFKRKKNSFNIDNACLGLNRDGWILDMEPDVWVNEDLLNDVVMIDEDTKWVYDRVSNGLRLRRRRWLRYAIIDASETNENEKSKQEKESSDGHEHIKAS